MKSSRHALAALLVLALAVSCPFVAHSQFGGLGDRLKKKASQMVTGKPAAPATTTADADQAEAPDTNVVAITADEQLVGYNLLAGGGMGRTHGNEETFPRLADVIGFLVPDQVDTVARAAITIHRDFGDRSNRKHARLKYLLADRGVDWFRAELEQRAGLQLAPARPVAFTHQSDLCGWHPQGDGKCFLGLFIETGRIKDTDARHLKTALRQVVAEFQPSIHLTPANNLYLGGILPEQREAITTRLAEHGISVASQGSVLRRAATACVSLPTCGLALAESERYLPRLVTQLESLLAEVGLGDQEIIIRMTGCPNGCARPYSAELGFVGRGPGRYQIWVGGNEPGTRLARVYHEDVKDADLVTELRPVLQRYAQERQAGERFGDWAARVLWAQAPKQAVRVVGLGPS